MEPMTFKFSVEGRMIKKKRHELAVLADKEGEQNELVCGRFIFF